MNWVISVNNSNGWLSCLHATLSHVLYSLGCTKKPIFKPSNTNLASSPFHSWRQPIKESRGAALGVEFEIGKGGHLRPLAATCRKRPLAATRGHLPKAATCGHLRPLAFCGHLRSLAATCPLRPLAVTCGHLPSAVTCGHLRSLGRFGRSLAPAATCGHLRKSSGSASDRE